MTSNEKLNYAVTVIGILLIIVVVFILTVSLSNALEAIETNSSTTLVEEE